MSAHLITAAQVVCMVLIGIGASKWSARRITDFADTEVQL
jgi:hypothetical protein